MNAGSLYSYEKLWQNEDSDDELSEIDLEEQSVDVAVALLSPTHRRRKKYKKMSSRRGGNQPTMTNSVLNETELNEFEEDVSSSKGKSFSVEDAVESAGLGWFQMKIILICGALGAADAMEMLLLSVLGPALRCEWQLSSAQIALITTIVFVGYFLGSPLWGKVADKYGRWTTFMVVLCIISYFGLLTSFSPSYPWLIILRGLVGFGIGGASTSFTLLSEYLPSVYRAKVLIATQVFWAIGSTFEISLAYAVLPIYGWRVLVAITSIPMFVFLFLMPFLPESARFQFAAGRKEEALATIRTMFRQNKRPMLEGELIDRAVHVDARGNFADLFSLEYRRTTLTLLLLWFTVAFSYYGIILISAELFRFHDTCYHATTSVVAPSGVPEEFIDNSCCDSITSDDYRAMLISSFGEFFVIPINMVLIDFLGRRRTMALGYFVTSLFFGCLYICVPKAFATALLFGIRGFTSGIFNTLYIYTSEVYPTTVRSLGVGFCSAMARFGSMSTPFVAQVIMPEWSVLAALLIYVTVTFACIIGSLILPIETLGRALPHAVTYRVSEPDKVHNKISKS